MSSISGRKGFRFSDNFFVFICILTGVLAVILAVVEYLAFATTPLWRRITTSSILTAGALVSFVSSLPCAFRSKSTSAWLGGTALILLGSASGFALSMVWNRHALDGISSTESPSRMDLGNLDVDFPNFADNVASLGLLGIMMAAVTAVHTWAVIKPQYARHHVARYILFCSVVGLSACCNFAFALLYMNVDLAPFAEISGRVLTTLQGFTIPMWISFFLWVVGGFCSCDMLLWEYASSHISNLVVLLMVVLQLIWVMLTTRQWTLPHCLDEALPNRAISISFAMSSTALVLMSFARYCIRPRESPRSKQATKTPSWLVGYDPRSPNQRSRQNQARQNIQAPQYYNYHQRGPIQV